MSAVMAGLLALPVLLSGEAGARSQQAASSEALSTTQGEILTRTFDHDGRTRTYRLYVPAAYHGQEGSSSADWPLVISYHGYSWVPTSHASLDGLNAVADTAHFLVARPLGLPIKVMPLGTNTCWNVDGGFGDWDEYDFTDADTGIAVGGYGPMGSRPMQSSFGRQMVAKHGSPC